jgi:hypothetical protein
MSTAVCVKHYQLLEEPPLRLPVLAAKGFPKQLGLIVG